jgi:hypothetical protein
MLYFDGFFGLVVIGLWIFCFIDVLVTPEAQCRTLPKLAWVFIVLLIPTIGSIGWLVAGRPWDRTAQPASLRSAARWSDDPEAVRRAPARPKGSRAPDDDEEFLAGLRRRTEEQRRRAREAKPRDVNPREQDGRPDAG